MAEEKKVEVNDNEFQEVEEIEESYQARRYMLTINNPTETDEYMYNYILNLEHFKYAAFQREKGHEKETVHFQIYIVFTIGKRFATIKKLFPTAHIEKANGSNIQCRDYCTKSDTRVSGPYEIGEFAEQRSRTDIKGFFQLLESGATDEEIKSCYPSIYYNKFDKLDALRQKALKAQMENKIRDDLRVTYVYGPTGVGKTFSIMSYYGLNKVYRVTDYKKDPFNGYTNQKIVVFEEYHSQFNISEFLTLTDIYPVEASARYNNKFLGFNRLFILSNSPLKTQYFSLMSEDYNTYKAFERRINNVLYFGRNGIIVEKCENGIEDLKSSIPPSMFEKIDLESLNNSQKQELKNSFSDEIKKIRTGNADYQEVMDELF